MTAPPLRVSVTLPTLYRGPSDLAGDAGYDSALTGNGTSLAMVGAYLLAGEGRSETQRRTRCGSQELRLLKDLTQIPPVFPTIMAPRTDWGIRIRNMLFFTASTALSWGLGSIFSWIRDTLLARLGRIHIHCRTMSGRSRTRTSEAGPACRLERSPTLVFDASPCCMCTYCS